MSENSQNRESSDGQSGGSDDNTIQNQCPICHNEITNRALTDSCLHEFCYQCLRQSSLHNNLCHHCWTLYSNIIHDIRSDTQFSRAPVSDPNDNPLALMSIVVNTRLVGLRDRLTVERQRLREEMRLLREQNSELDDNQRTRMQSLMRSLTLINETTNVLNDISQDLTSNTMIRGTGVLVNSGMT